jgi:hypothetical protein
LLSIHLNRETNKESEHTLGEERVLLLCTFSQTLPISTNYKHKNNSQYDIAIESLVEDSVVVLSSSGYPFNL